MPLTKYKPEFNEQAYRLALLGLRNVDIANVFGVVHETITDWNDKYPAFRDALKRGKQEADSKVAESMYKLATGYLTPDTHISNYKGNITLTPYLKNVPPNVTAGIFWLKNRHGDLWSDRQDINLVDKDLQDLTDEELEKRRIELVNKTLKVVK